MDGIDTAFKELARLVPKYVGRNLEIEANFGSVPEDVYLRVKSFLASYSTISSHEITTDKTYSGDIRETLDVNGQTKEIIVKNRLEVIERGLFRLKISSERPFTGQLPTGVPDLVRTKDRLTYTVPGAKVDLTMINETKNGVQIKKYEIEVEATSLTVTNIAGGISDLRTIFEKVFHVVLDSDILYDKNEREYIFGYINGDFETDNRKTTNRILNTILNKPKDLKFANLTYGNPNSVLGSQPYRVTQKSDGIHKFLLYDTKGIYLFHPPMSLSKLFDTKNMTEHIRKNYENNLVGSLIEGELMTADTKEKKFVIFDVLYAPGGASVMDTTHQERLQYGYELIEPNNDMAYGLSLVTKQFHTLSAGADSIGNVRTFIKAIEAASTDVTDFSNDGLVFVPDIPYREQKIFKWKPWEKLSIDFYVGTDYKLFVETTDGLVEFEGTDKFEFLDATMDIPEDSIGRVVEFFPHRLNDKIVFKFGKIRFDKQKPNFVTIANDVWDNINSPIKFDCLTGKSIDLAIKYHNRIKGDLLATGKGSILDIGSGRGGDLWKMSGYNRICLVEPDAANLKELRTRLEKFPTKQKVTVIQAGGEDLGLIDIKASGKFDIVSSMLSMSFFFGDDEKLNNLCKTVSSKLNIGGRFIFLTINGYEVRRLLRINRARQNLAPTDDVTIKLNNVVMTYYPKYDDVKIEIAGSIVRGQIEYFVDLKKLELIFEKNGIVLDYLQQANKEKFLSDDERQFSNLYTYGSFLKTSDVSPFVNHVFTGNMRRVPYSGIDDRLIGYTVGKAGAQKTAAGENVFTSRKDITTNRHNVPRHDITVKGRDYQEIETIGDGNCFFHSVLMSCCELYQNDSSNRQAVCTEFRNGIAVLVDDYFSLTGLENVPDYNTPEKLKDLLQTNEFVGDEVVIVTSYVIKKNIVVFAHREDGKMYKAFDTTETTVFDTSILMIHRGNHYESIGLKTLEGIQTIFPINFDFLNVLMPGEYSEVTTSDDGKKVTKTYMFPEIRKILSQYMLEEDDLLNRIKNSVDLREIDPFIGVNPRSTVEMTEELKPYFLKLYDYTSNYNYFLVYFFLHLTTEGELYAKGTQPAGFYKLVKKYAGSKAVSFPYKKFYTPIDGIFDKLISHRSKEIPYKFKPAFHSAGGSLDSRFEGKYIAVDSGDAYSIDVLSDLYQEEQRVMCTVKNRISPMQYWMDEADVIAMKTSPDTISETMREYIYNNSKECTQFKPTYAAHMFRRFKATKILDFSAGWGDRLLAAMAVDGVKRYLAFDPNVSLKPGHDAMISDYALAGTKMEIRYQPFETADLGTEKFDMIFTSPPYFDLELYQGDKQSVQTFNKLDSWLQGFLYVSIKKGWTNLEPKGHLVIHIADTKDDKIVEPMNTYIQTMPGAKFLGMLGSVGGEGKVRPAWVWQKTK